jgi:hypothetical protein
MNSHIQVIRIVCMLAVIFAAGVVTGRFTAPQKTRVIVGPEGRGPTAKMILDHFKMQVPLTVEEEIKMRRLIEQIETDISRFEPGSKERLEIFHRAVPKMKEILSAEKHAAVDRYAKDLERKVENSRRRRGLE